MLDGLITYFKSFGFGLSGLVPMLVYYLNILVMVLSLFYNPVIGILFLFPLLPYQSIFTKINSLPLGKSVVYVIVICITLGWLFKKGSDKGSSEKTEPLPEHKILSAAIMFLIVVNFIGVIVAYVNNGWPMDPDDSYVKNWISYMIFPVIWFLIINVIKDRKTLLTLSTLVVLGIVGVDRYFYSNLGWMNTWHYDDRTKDMMSGLFVYLGANHYGAFFAHYIFPLIGFLFFVRSKFKKALLAGFIWLTGYCLLFTFSRGAYVALIAGLLVIAIMRVRWLLIVLIFLGFSWKAVIPGAVRERIEMTKNQETGELEESAAIRIQLWDTAVGMFTASPLVGQGFNTFRMGPWRDTHNFYMKMLAELGILGLISFLFLCYASFMISLKLYKESTDNFYKGLALGFCACVVSVLCTNMFGDRWSYLPLGAYYWIFLGVVTKALLLTMEEKAAGTQKKKVPKKAKLATAT